MTDAASPTGDSAHVRHRASTESGGQKRDLTYPPIIVAAKTAFRLLGQRIDLGEIWALAVAGARDKLADDGGPARPLPSECPFAVGDLVQRVPDIDALLARVAGASGPPAKG